MPPVRRPGNMPESHVYNPWMRSNRASFAIPVKPGGCSSQRHRRSAGYILSPEPPPCDRAKYEYVRNL